MNMLLPDAGIFPVDSPLLRYVSYFMIAVACIWRIWRDTHKEIDIASGIDAKDVRRYYRRFFHGKSERSEYRKLRATACGVMDEGEFSELDILRAQAREIRYREKHRISMRAGLVSYDVSPDPDTEEHDGTKSLSA